MSRAAHALRRRTVAAGSGPAGPPAPSGRPNLRGDLDTMLEPRPCFGIAVRGYDRLQVDNYVAWVETELQLARRLADELAARYGACSAELEIAQRLLAHSPRAREFARLSERVAEILQLAADEAADVTGAAATEAEHIVSEARAEAAAMLQQAREIKEAALAASDRLREEQRRVSSDATAVLDRARAEAARTLADAAATRERLDAAAAGVRHRAAVGTAHRLAHEEEQARQRREATAAAAAAALADVQREVDDLRRQRDEVCASLRRLGDDVGAALQELAAHRPGEVVVVDGGQRVAFSGEGVRAS